MDYSSHRFRAVVDWIEIEVQTARSTNFWTIQNALREIQDLTADVNPFVKPLNESAGGAATAYTIRIQEPKRLSDVIELLNHFTYVVCNLLSFRVTAIEIALDAYGTSAEQAARFYKFATYMADDNNHRLYREKNVDQVRLTPHNFKSLVRHLAQGWQIGIGDEGDDHYQHCYWKTTDNNGKAIPASEYRARIEIRLRGAALPCQTLEQWQDFSFASLSRYFRFRELRDDLAPIERVTAGALAQIGQQRKRNRREGGIRLHSRLTKADTALNSRAHDALRELSRRWKAQSSRPKKQTVRTRPAMVMAEPACGNIGEVEAANPHESLKKGADSNNYRTHLLDATEGQEKEQRDDDQSTSVPHAPIVASRHNSSTDDKEHRRSLDSLRSSSLTNDLDADVETLFPELFNQSPELDAEQNRIDALFE